MKNSLDWFNSRLDMAEGTVSKLITKNRNYQIQNNKKKD